MAISALAAIAAAAATTYAGYQGSQNAQAANKTSAGIASNNLQNAENQQQYQHMLDAIAMKRSVAGSVDARGDQLAYNPATNTWETKLSPSGQRLQSAADSAAFTRNTRDVGVAGNANDNAMLDAIKARSAAGPALAAVRNFRPMTSQGLEGDLQQTATTANRNAQDPIIADTLRQFARTGTAAGPVLTNMMRDNATTLRQTMLTDKIEAMKNVGAINNTNRSGLVSAFDSLNNASKPALNYPGISTGSPNDALIQEMTGRATAAPQSASTGAYSLSSATNASNLASQEAAKNPGQSNSGATLLAGVDGLKGLFDPNGSVMKYLNNGSGNAGDQPTYKTDLNTYPANFGDINKDGVGMFGLRGPQ